MLKRAKQLRGVLTIKKGQSTIEYMMLLGVVMAFVLVSFKTRLPEKYMSANEFFNAASVGILGAAPACGDRHCDNITEVNMYKCPVDCS